MKEPKFKIEQKVYFFEPPSEVIREGMIFGIDLVDWKESKGKFIYSIDTGGGGDGVRLVDERYIYTTAPVDADKHKLCLKARIEKYKTQIKELEELLIHRKALKEDYERELEKLEKELEEM